MLSLFEKIKKWLYRSNKNLWQGFFFYYVIHLYAIHIVSAAFVLIKGNSMAEATIISGDTPFYFLAAKDGYSLLLAYIIWIAVVIAIFPLCKWSDNYKTHHKEKWWLSYL